MTDEERYIVQGRARDSAKKLQADLATLQMFFRDYSDKLETTRDAIDKFLDNPRSKGADGRPMFDLVNQFQRNLCEAGFWDKTTEFADTTDKLRTIEEQIKNF